jgi:hypothetical protein
VADLFADADDPAPSAPVPAFANDAVVRLVPPAAPPVVTGWCGFAADTSPEGERLIGAWLAHYPGLKGVVEHMHRAGYGAIAHLQRVGGQGGFSMLAGNPRQLLSGLDALLAKPEEIDWTHPVAYVVPESVAQAMEERFSGFPRRKAAQSKHG